MVASASAIFVGAVRPHVQSQLGDLLQVVVDGPGVSGAAWNVVVYEDFALNAAQGISHRANANLNFVRGNLQDSGSRFAHQRTERVPDGSS